MQEERNDDISEVSYFCHLFQNAVIMTIGLAAMGICIGYIAYMRTKYENMGYYAAVNRDGEESFVQKKSKWD